MLMKKKEYVVLVDKRDRQIGIEEKGRVHTSRTPLHRAFSLFLFTPDNRLLLQQRSAVKKTWPLVWSNSCCGHPMPSESYENAVKRRTRFELGVNLDRIVKVADYQYCFSKDGVMENEICPIFAAMFNGKVRLNRDEIETVRRIKWKDWLAETRENPGNYSPWCIEETQIMASNDTWKSKL